MGGTCSVVGDVKGKGNDYFKAGKYEEVCVCECECVCVCVCVRACVFL